MLKWIFSVLIVLTLCVPTALVGDSKEKEHLYTEKDAYIKLPFVNTEKELLIGEVRVKIVVIATVNNYDLETCEGRKNEHGFHIGQREDSQKLIIYCGKNELGKVYFTKKQVGI